MIEKVLQQGNLLKAYRQVLTNKGSAGVDGMPVGKLSDHLKVNRDRIVTAIANGSYLPQAILGVEIPKSNGKKRLLGIPTVTDRLLQQAVNQAIAPLFELDFKAQSYGFRPGRNARPAVLQAQKNINEGYQHLVDIDLITLKRLAKRGNESLLDYYRKVSLQLNAPLYARPARTVV
jgi:retron-type reverse transcriptase